MAKEPMARRLRVYEQWQGNEVIAPAPVPTHLYDAMLRLVVSQQQEQHVQHLTPSACLMNVLDMLLAMHANSLELTPAFTIYYSVAFLLQHFFCWGRCVAGPSWKSGMGTLALLIAPTVVFLVFVAPYMSARVTPAILVIR